MFVFPVYSIVFWWVSSKGWDKTRHVQMQQSSEILGHSFSPKNCRHHHHHDHPPMSPPPPLYHNHHNWRKLRFHIFHFSFWGKSHTKASFHIFHVQFLGKSRTKTSFSHLPLSVFERSLARKLRFQISHFQFQQLIQETSEPCHVLRLLVAHLGRATCAKKNSFSASNGPASGR